MAFHLFFFIFLSLWNTLPWSVCVSNQGNVALFSWLVFHEDCHSWFIHRFSFDFLASRVWWSKLSCQRVWLLVSCVKSLISLPWSLCAAIANSFRLGSLKRIYIFLLNCLETGKSKTKVPSVSESGKGAVPDSRQPYFHYECTLQRDRPRQASEVSSKTTLTSFMSSNFMI